MNIEMVVFIGQSVHSFILDYCIFFMEKGKHGHHTFILQKSTCEVYSFFYPFYGQSTWHVHSFASRDSISELTFYPYAKAGGAFKPNFHWHVEFSTWFDYHMQKTLGA